MNYELAKRLKDVGFPGSDKWEETIYDTDPPNYGMSYTPILEELIDACRGKVRMFLNTGDGTGWAYAVDGIGASGGTLEEAVANLWLKLNEKHKD